MSKPGRKQSRGKRGVSPKPANNPTAAPPSKPFSGALSIAARVAVPVAFFAFVWMWHPFHDVSEFDPDEGNNVIKAMMVADGHPLYSETWSDQPPVFTYMLRYWFAITDWSAHQGRIMVLLCSSVLLWALFEVVRSRWGFAAGLATAFMLMTSYRYLALSVGVMLGLPTLMFAVLSVYALSRWRDKPHAAWMIASGGLLAVSLCTKMLALPVVPLIFAAAVYCAWSRRDAAGATPGWRWLKPVLLWAGGALGAGVVVVLLTIPLGDIGQLISPHLAAREKMAVAGFDEVFLGMVRADWVFASLGVVGVLRIVRRREWFSLLAVAWALAAYVLLWKHRPLWYHHYPMLGIPLCWAAGIGVGALFSGELWRSLIPWRGGRSVFAGLILLLAAVFGVWGIVRIGGTARTESKFAREMDYAQRYVRATPADEYTVAVLEQFADKVDYMVTDRQMLAFRAGIMVPPELSVTSVKRMRSGSLTMEDYIALLEKYQPGVIHRSFRAEQRVPMRPELADYLRANYVQLYTGPRRDQCYVSKLLSIDLVSVLERAVAKVPRSADGRYYLGVQLSRAGRYEDAVREFESSVEIRGTTHAYNGLGSALKRVGRYDDAATAFETLGKALKRQNKAGEAAKAFGEAQRCRDLASG